MTNKVQEFLNEKFGEVRVVKINEEVWFVASDVARVLMYEKASDMTRNLDDDEKDTQTLLTLGGDQDMTVINESGLYNAVLSITKRNKERYDLAREFKKWITGIVIPAIRKDGAYISGEENFAKGEMSEDEFVLKAMTILQNKVTRLQEENKKMKPKADAWDQFLDSDGTYNFEQVAKLISTRAGVDKVDLKISVIKLTEFLRDEGVLSKARTKKTFKNTPNIEYEDFFNVSTVQLNGFSKTQTRVKASGVKLIYDLVKEKYDKTA